MITLSIIIATSICPSAPWPRSSSRTSGAARILLPTYSDVNTKQIDPIKVYQDIFWEARSVVETGHSPLPDLPSLNSSIDPNYVEFSSQIAATVMYGTFQTMFVYSGPTIGSFPFQWFLHDCAHRDEASMTCFMAGSCNITILGLTLTETQVAQEIFEY